MLDARLLSKPFQIGRKKRNCSQHVDLNLSCYLQQQILGSSKNCWLDNKNMKIYSSTTCHTQLLITKKSLPQLKSKKGPPSQLFICLCWYSLGLPRRLNQHKANLRVSLKAKGPKPFIPLSAFSLTETRPNAPLEVSPRLKRFEYHAMREREWNSVVSCRPLGGFHLHLLVFPFVYQFNSRIGVLVKSSFEND